MKVSWWLSRVHFENNIFEHNTCFYIKLRETAIGTKTVPSHAIVFIGSLEEIFLEDFDKKIVVW